MERKTRDQKLGKAENFLNLTVNKIAQKSPYKLLMRDIYIFRFQYLQLE